MFPFRFKRSGKFRQISVFGASLLLLASGLFLQPPSLGLAQEGTTAAPTAAPPSGVSVEVQQAVESDLAVSPEAAKELAIDLPAELNLEGYDPIIPDGPVGKILYPLKEVVWDVQEGLSQTFASDASYSQLMSEHANKELVAATKLYASTPSAGQEVIGILQEYKDDLNTVAEKIPVVKEEDPVLAKMLSAEIAEDHLFVAPKVLGSIQDNLLASDPEVVPSLVEIKNQVLASAGTAIVNAADNEQEVTKALETIAGKRQLTPFSGIANAEILSSTKEQLGNAVPIAMSEAFDQAIGEQLQTVETNLQNLSSSDEVKAESFGKYVAQLPGHSLERMKIIDQFKSETALPPVMIAKMQEIKAKLAETIGVRIQQVVQEEVRQAISQAMLEFKNPGVPELKILNEFKDLVPQEEIRQEIVKNHEAQVQKFLDRFSDDANAKAVTEEFQGLASRVESGQVIPDANFFKTLTELKGRLNPEQQRFIGEMEVTGRQEMANRLQNDPNFPERFATSNPADLQIFEKIRESGFGPQFAPPPGFDFEAKFREIEQQQAENFGRFLEFQNRPEDVAAIRAQFETSVPPQIRERFEQNYDFQPETFAKQEALARDKEEFLRQKFEAVQKEFQEKFGSSAAPGGFPGQTPIPFPGGRGFSFPGGANFPAGFPPPFRPLLSGDEGSGSSSGQTFSCPAGMKAGEFGCEFDFQRPQSSPTSCPPEMTTTPFGCVSRSTAEGSLPPPGQAGQVPEGVTSPPGFRRPPSQEFPYPPSGAEFKPGEQNVFPSHEPSYPSSYPRPENIAPEGYSPPLSGFAEPRFAPPEGFSNEPLPSGGEPFAGFVPPPEGFQAPPPAGAIPPPPPLGEPAPAVQGVFTGGSRSALGIFNFLSVFGF